MSEARATQGLRELIAKWLKFADTDHSPGMKLSDSRKQGQYELMMAGQSLAYATAAKQLEALLPALESALGERQAVCNLSQQDYDNLVRDAMLWRAQKISVPTEDAKFAADFIDVFGGFPKDQAIAMMIRRFQELRRSQPSDETREVADQIYQLADKGLISMVEQLTPVEAIAAHEAQQAAQPRPADEELELATAIYQLLRPISFREAPEKLKEVAALIFAHVQKEVALAVKHIAVPMLLSCPKCGKQHVDEGEWATRKHRTHQCQFCTHEWKPYEYSTFGIEPQAAHDREIREKELLLREKFSDLAVELEKHSNDHIRDPLPDNLGAAVEGVCADRINAILRETK